MSNTVVKVIGVVLLVAVFLIAFFGVNKNSDFNPEFNKENQVLSVQVVPHKSRVDLNRAYNEYVGSKDAAPLNTPRLGWSTWPKEGECVIHMDNSRKERNVREYIDTLGHEYAHCLYGKYHD